jgi:hypothetical protein
MLSYITLPAILFFSLGSPLSHSYLSYLTLFAGGEISNNMPISQGVIIEPKLRKVDTNTWQIEITVLNEGDKPILMMTSPKRSDGTDGIYLTLDRGRLSLLNLKIVFEDVAMSGVKLWNNEAGVIMQPLFPGKSHTATFQITLPIVETMPPYRRLKEIRKIHPGEIKNIRVSLGILPYDAGILSLLEKKLKRSFANGSEVILEGQYKSKRLLQLQTIINSEELLFVY